MKIKQSFSSFYKQEQCWHSALKTIVLLSGEEMKVVRYEGTGYPTSCDVKQKPH